MRERHGRRGAIGSGRDDACGRRCYSHRVKGAIQVGGLGHQRTSSRYAPTGAGIGDAKAVRREGQGLRRQRSPQPGRKPRHDGAYGERPSRRRRGARQHRRRGLRGWIHSSGYECTGESSAGHRPDAGDGGAGAPSRPRAKCQRDDGRHRCCVVAAGAQRGRWRCLRAVTRFTTWWMRSGCWGSSVGC